MFEIKDVRKIRVWCKQIFKRTLTSASLENKTIFGIISYDLPNIGGWSWYDYLNLTQTEYLSQNMVIDGSWSCLWRSFWFAFQKFLSWPG